MKNNMEKPDISRLHEEALEANKKADGMVERWEAATPQEAIDILQAIDERQEKIENNLLQNEKTWRLSPEDEGDPRVMSEFAKNREAKITGMARERLRLYQEEMEQHGKTAFQTHEEYQEKVEEEKYNIKYFPVLFVSAPHIEPGVSGTFGGEPTPLMYATAVLDRYTRIDEFPSFKTPDVKAVLNPAVYDKEFENSLVSYVGKFKPRVIGISNISEGHHYALKIAETIKRLSPDTIIIMGGAHEDGTNPEVYKRAAEQVKTKSKRNFAGVRPPTETYELSEEHMAKMGKIRTFAKDEERELIDFVISGDAPYLLMELMKIIADNLDTSADELKKIIFQRRDELARIEGSGDLFFYDREQQKIQDIEISGTPLDRNNLPFMFRARLTRENRYPIFNNKKTAQVMACVGCVETCEFCFESASTTLYGVPKLQQRKPENVIKELDLLKEQNYEAIFFDDSTFTQNPHITNRLMELMIEKRKSGEYFEWGCQTTIRSVDPEQRPGLLRKMAETGCTYIYFGLEQAEPDIEHVQKASKFPIHKKSWTKTFEDVCQSAKEAGIRVGCSLQFGLGETPDQWQKTIDLVKKMCEQGYIAKNSVAININTPYPETEEWIKLAKKEGNLPDYRDKLKRHPRFETSHQFSSLAWQSADEIYALAKPQLGEALVGVSFSNKEIEQHIERYRNIFERDFYFNDEIYQEYLEGKREGVHFNSAAIAAPFAEVREAAKKVFERENELTDVEKSAILNEARKKAADLVNLSDERGVTFGRNTTEAASFVYWLAGLQKGDKAVLTNGENLSIQRLFELHLDHGNPKRNDGWSAWPTWYSKRGQKYQEVLPDKTGIETVVIEAITADIEKLEQEMREQIDENTKVFVFSHVLRDSGREFPVKQIVEIARKVKAEKNPQNPDLFVLVDGAQALGNVPKIDFAELGCDAYVATPHKTMKSEVVGLLYFNPDNPKIQENLKRMNNLYYRDEQVVLDGVFDPRLGIQANVADSISYADVAGFSEAVNQLKSRGLEGNDFSKIAQARQETKDYFTGELKNLNIGVEFPEVDNPTSFIVNFGIEGKNQKEVAERLSEKGVFVSFIDRNPDDQNAKYFRAAFQPDNTREEVDKFIGAIMEVIS
jgi:selenocysteine lyase/cysteine desulfurase/radical SAM superfamily enzyme YgiQ (UPF0313 family)